MWQTIGQSKALALLEHSLVTGDLAHAYLFVGAQHIGKMTMALDLARALNCEGDKPPCSECKPCRRISNGKHSDITVIGLNSTNSLGEVKQRVEIGIDDIRELQRNTSFPPYEGKCKIFIIDRAEHLSSEAANCLLKTLEEPPPRVVILLLTADELRLLPTVVSRCQRVELKPMSAEEVQRVLIESHGAENNRARLLARLSQGCLGWAITALTDDSYLTQRDQRLTEMFYLLDVGWHERFAYAAKLGSDRKSAEEVINLWLTWWRDMMLIKCDCSQAITNVDQISVLEKWVHTLSLSQVRNFIDSLQKSLSQIALNANLRLVLEILMLEMPRKEETRGHAISAPVSL
jgi:DNA polymerase-3 subunit delta'